MKNYIQIQIENSEDFKNEIIKGVVEKIKDLAFNNKVKEEDADELISRSEAASILKISLVKLWELTKEKKLEKFKIGGKVFYQKSDLVTFINSQKSNVL